MGIRYLKVAGFKNAGGGDRPLLVVGHALGDGGAPRWLAVPLAKRCSSYSLSDIRERERDGEKKDGEREEERERVKESKGESE